MITSYKLCRYPANGFGDKCNMFYLINQFGKIIDFVSEYDQVLDERHWVIEVPGYSPFHSESIADIVEQMKANGLTIKKW